MCLSSSLNGMFDVVGRQNVDGILETKGRGGGSGGASKQSILERNLPFLTLRTLGKKGGLVLNSGAVGKKITG